jgi:pimeloyl-ACP methyl ester carboxylesterase
MRKKNVFLLGFGLFLIIVSIWQIFLAYDGLKVINLNNTNPPVTIIAPSNTDSASRPTLLIAHGFAGSSVLMRGFALTLAHAGFTTVSWDFQGHGHNANPMINRTDPDNLQYDAESALANAEATGLVDMNRVAILGHSMGSGVSLKYGMAHPETAATVAISPVLQAITSDSPRNLLLMAGSLEQKFVRNAEQILSQGGGDPGNAATGTARKLVIIPNTEHISILFSPKTHLEARTWFDDTFGTQTGAMIYADRRILWYGLGILGFILVANTCINIISNPSQGRTDIKSLRTRMLALIIAGIIATLCLWVASQIGIKINHSLGLLVGGYLIIWFGIAGVSSWLILKPGFSKPLQKEILIGLIAFSALWLGVGILGNYVWLPWILISNRFLLWIPGAIMLLPWFYSVGYASSNASALSFVGWWLYQVITILVSLFLAIMMNPELGFLYLILPLVPVMIGLHMLVISSKHGLWAYASSGAMFTAWVIVAVFPLS